MRGVKSAELIGVVSASGGELRPWSDLSIDEKRKLLTTWSKEVEAAASAVDAPKKRLAAIQAASVSTNARMKDAYVTASKGLAKLGYALDAVAGTGSIADVEAKMREHKWTSIQQIGLKTALARIGAIS